jgi:branched-chain amino acid transport system permease protein
MSTDISPPQPGFAKNFSRHNLSWLDFAPFVLIAGLYFVAGSYVPLITQVMIMSVFALSLDLILGYGGVETLGQAALFGAGAYGAGIFALRATSDPVAGLVIGGLSGAIVAAITGPIVLKTRGITLVMMTLAVATMLLELANTMQWLTGGADGLYGFNIAPLLGVFPFELDGRTAYWYAAVVLLIVFMVCKVVVNSSFGLTIRGIRENRNRMRLLGVPVMRRLLMMYVISGFLAGIAGGLSAQTTQLVALDSFSFVLSGNVLIMLILGGAGSLNGAILGAALFVVVSDRAAAVSPFHWLFALGVSLILIVRYAPSGLVSLRARRGPR